MTMFKTTTRVVCFLLGLCILVGSFGCQSGTTSFDPTKAYSKGIGFCYPGLQWGMTIQEVENALGISLGDAFQGSEGSDVDYRTVETYEYAYFQPKAKFTWQDMEGLSIFQFTNGRLWAAGITCPAEKTKEEFDALADLLADAYGLEPIQEENSTGDTTFIGYRWVLTDNNGVETRAVLTGQVSGNGINSVSLDFSEYPIQY